MDKKKTALLQYFVTDEKCFVFLIKKEFKEPMVFEASVGEEDLLEIHKRLAAGVRNYNSKSKTAEQWNNLYRKNLNGFFGLGEKLVDCFCEELKDTELLYIVPHKVLHGFPFHAMKSGDKYLIEKYEIIYVPSSSILKYCQEVNPSRDENFTIKNSIVFGSWKRRDCNNSFQEHTQNECNAIQENLGSSLYLGLDASKENVLKNIYDQDIIHFACHGFFNKSDETMETSGLLLNDGESFPENFDSKDIYGEKEHFLSAVDILDLKLNCSLVTLSSCETGESDNIGGDELLGLARAFFYGKVPTVLMSLWVAQADSKVVFMKEFYAVWKENLDKGKSFAFQKAMVKLINDDEYCVLPHWGTYYITGDWK